MKNKKVWLSAVLAALLLASGCGNNAKQDTVPAQDEHTASQVADDSDMAEV